MDTFLILGWVLLCDVVMVYVTYRLAWREGAKARAEIEAKYADAMANVARIGADLTAMEGRLKASIPPTPNIPTPAEIVAALPPYPTIPPYPKIPTPAEIVAALPPVRIPDEEIARISGAVNGAIGNIIKAGAAGAREGEAEVVETIQAAMSPSERIQNAIMGRVMDLISGTPSRKK
jgi:hypothetical protein